VNGSNMEVQRTANQEPLVKFGNVPIAGVDVLRIPARYQPLTRPKKMGAITRIDHLKYDLEPERGISF
jgi:hypothetical protein